ncbi:MAG: AMP-binding protein [Phyllobacteriaceae bacterium]|nr:AMP-binding protein [Phyllobacteriaceae bacterium]
MKALARWTAKWSTARATKSIDARLAAIANTPDRSLRDEVEEWAAEGRDRPALIGAEETLAYRDLYARSNRWARWAIVHGVGAGDPVVLLFPPRPERFAALVGLTAVGAVVGFADPRLPPSTLAAAIGAIRPAHVVVDATRLDRFEAAAAHLAHACTVWVHGAHGMAYQRIDEALAEFSAVRLIGPDRRRLDHAAPCLLVVEARDDGRPHVERLDQGRLTMLACELAGLVGASRDDRLTVVEDTLTLETLLAPVIALARGAPCRLCDARHPAPLGEPTLLHLDAAWREPLPLSVRLLVTSARGPLALAEIADVVTEIRPRRWRLFHEAERIVLDLDDRRIVLPLAADAIRS